MINYKKLGVRKSSERNQAVTMPFVKNTTKRKQPITTPHPAQTRLAHTLPAQIFYLPTYIPTAASLTKTAPSTQHPKEHRSMQDPNPEISQHILSSAPMAMLITDDAGLVLWCNETLSHWIGSPANGCIGHTETEILNIDEPADAKIHILTNNGPFSLGKTASGNPRRVMRCALLPLDGQHSVIYIDVSEEEALRAERTQLAQQLEQHNTVDNISGLLNEHAVNMGLEPLLSRSRRYQNPLSVVTMNVMNFEQINGSAGQVGVDKTIVAVSQLLRDQMRWADLVGRFDSGQFVFVLPETDKIAAIALANKISTQLKNLNISIDDQLTAHPQVCFGVTAWEKGDDIRLLLARSDSALQTALQKGVSAVEAA